MNVSHFANILLLQKAIFGIGIVQLITVENQINIRKRTVFPGKTHIPHAAVDSTIPLVKTDELYTRIERQPDICAQKMCFVTSVFNTQIFILI